MPEDRSHAPGAVLDRISIARQPIVDAQRTILAYQLFNRSQHSTSHSEASDIVLALHALAHAEPAFANSTHDVFIHCVHKGLSGPQWDFLKPEKTVVEIGPVPQHAPALIAQHLAALQALKAQGFRLAFKHTVIAPVYKLWHELADFIKIDLSQLDKQQYKPLVTAAQQRTSATLIAEKIETQEQFESILACGVHEFQGYWFSVPETLQTKVLTPSQTAAIQLFKLVQSESPLDEVELVLKKDAALSVNLLRIINAVGMGLRQKVTSLRQAVMLLGYGRMGRWAAMLLTHAGQHASMQASTAVVRGRMMELLAEIDMEPKEAGSAFLVGLLSQMDHMLGIPMANLVHILGLDDTVTLALLERQGKLGHLLALVCACESDSDTAFNNAFAQLTYTMRQINIAHMEALVWADSMEA